MTQAIRLAFCCAVLLPLLSHGQGYVRMSNDFIVPGTRRKAIVGFDSGPLSKEFGRVEVVDWNGTVLKSGGLVSDGIFSLGVTVIPEIRPGGIASVIIRAWDTRYGATYNQAISPRKSNSFPAPEPVHSGQAWVTLTGLSGGATPPPSLAATGNFRGILKFRLSNGLPGPPFAEISDGTLRIQSKGLVGTGLKVWASTNLQHWNEAAALQVVPPDPDSWFNPVQWNLQPSSPVMFFTVTFWWDQLP